jgi:serine/threonine-protein kinase
VVGNAYQVRKLLGTSSSGQVFEAWDMVLERLVALKVGWRDQAAPSLIAEARALAAVGDDCVVQVHGFGNYHGVEYMVMEGVVGMTLADQIAESWAGEHRMSVDHALRILIALADGLASVHRAGLAHRDLRPDNILYPGGGRVLLTGLGVTSASRQAGRAPAIAPEVIGGAADADPHKIDLYALGAVAVELLTGAAPYAGGSLQEVVDAHAHAELPDLCSQRPELPTELGDLVHELLAKDPAQRPTSARLVTEQLRVIHARVQSRPRRDAVTVLVIDDSADEVRAIWSRLRRAHPRVEVEAARNATDAIAQIRRDAPQIILFSMELPGSMNGFELAMYLQGSGDARRSTFVALVDEVNERAQALLAELGVARVIERGADLGDELALLIRSLADDSLRGPVAVSG